MDESELAELFAPHIIKRREALKTGMRLVHCTSAEGAFRIIAGKQIWLRNAQMMNDFSEIQHGLNCLYAAWASPAGNALQEMLERIKSGLRNELAELFDGHTESFRLQTFITSLSEHDDTEDKLGRLSMWRAYGGVTGVALVLNNTAFAAETDEMSVYSSPVFYQNPEEFVGWFQGWANSIVAAEARLTQLDAETVRNWLFMAFRSFALCTKHPAFAEEREWRVFYSPLFDGNSDWIAPETEIIRGNPQYVMKLQLKDNPERGVHGVAPHSLINRVIIGPCEYPIQVRTSIAAALEQAGVTEPLQKMWMSLIPLRNS